MPTITVEYEVIHRVSVEVEVPDSTVAQLDEDYTLDALEPYGITHESLQQRCMTEGWTRSDFAVNDERYNTIIPWDED